MPEPSPSDDATTVDQLKQLVADFVAERDWRQFHAPKNLSMALAVEASELMEHFQWIDGDASRRITQDDTKLAAVAEELADVLAYSLAMANELGIDISSTVRAKMEKNIAKYPAGEFRSVLPRIDHGRNAE